jgi:bifunctional non-homologous end joining protein LigD
MAAAQPERYTARMAKTARPGKIFIDYHRNSRGATAVAAYSTRARPGAPVALPISWHQLTLALRPDEFTIKTVQPAADPWSDFFKIRQDLR